MQLSGYMRKKLLPEEKIVETGHFPGIYVFNCYMTLIVLGVAGGALQYAISRYIGFDTRHVPLLGGALIGFLLFMLMMIKMWTTEIVLTDRRLIYKRGFISINVDEVDIEQLASQKMEQTILGRFLDFGEVHIRCIEASDIWLPAITNPNGFINALERQKQHYRENYSKSVRLRQHGA